MNNINSNFKLLFNLKQIPYEMFLARLDQGLILKKIIYSIQGLVENVNINIEPT